MARLTLSFRDRILKVFTLTADTIEIGRDADCSISIDSLAIELRHATLRPGEDGAFVIEPASKQAAIHVNDTEITAAQELQDGDRILIGKHTLKFSASGDTVIADDNVIQLPAVGWLQIQSGSHLGRTIRLDKAFTRIGKPDEYLAVLAHREDGYILSHLHGHTSTRVNDQDIGDQSYALANGDQINIGELQVQFFSDVRTFQQSGTAPAEPRGQKQRRFSRIPFKVRVTIQDNDQSRDTDLIDISLHGVLIRTPEGIETAENTPYRLAIHLEDGPDINMGVHVAHCNQEYIGLRCDDIDVDSISHLRRLVELNLGDPSLLERELGALGQ